MAAEAQRANRCSREQGSFAAILRRFIATIEPWYDWGRTNTFRLDARCPKFSDESEGEVAVYDELWASGKAQHEPLVEDGGVYVIQYQRPAAAMTWDMWWANRNGYCPSLLEVRYELVVANHSSMPGREDKWQTRPLRDAQPGVFICTDGPLDEIHLTNKIVGKVVGIYNPAAFTGGAA